MVYLRRHQDDIWAIKYQIFKNQLSLTKVVSYLTNRADPRICVGPLNKHKVQF